MDDFIKSQGLPFMAHLLRRLYDDFVRSIAAWYPEVGVTAPPRTHSTMLALDARGPLGLTEIAGILRQSHPLVLTWVRQLKELGFVRAEGDPADARRTLLSLTEAGQSQLARNEAADAIVGATYTKLMADADADVFDALWRLEEACRKRAFIERLRDETARTASA